MSDVDVVVVNDNVPYVSVTGTNLPGMAGPTGAKGNTGAQGPRGFETLSGEGVPPSTLGKNGDFYIDSPAMKIYGPKTSGTWGTGRDLRGPIGPTGPVGPRGPTGPSGAAANVSYAGTGSAGTAARSDHNHLNWLNMHTSGTMIGSGIPNGASVRMQFGTYVGVCARNGSLNVPFPQPFPNGLITVVCNAGDNVPRVDDTTGAGIGLTGVMAVMRFTTLSQFRVALYAARTASGYLDADTMVRVNYVAYGW